MTTVHTTRSSTMTSEAYDLLDGFASGLNDIIYDIAEDIAANRGQVRDGVVEISLEDMRLAAELVFKAIREQAGKTIPEGAAEQIDRAHAGVLEKFKTREAG